MPVFSLYANLKFNYGFILKPRVQVSCFLPLPVAFLFGFKMVSWSVWRLTEVCKMECADALKIREHTGKMPDPLAETVKT